jgi:hypothetical protein
MSVYHRYHPLPAYLVKRLQRTQNAVASSVFNKYVKDVNDIIRLGWLPVEQHRDYQKLKLTFKAIYFEQWPSYLKLDFATQRGFRSNSALRLQIPLVKGTFQDCAARIFNNLPPELRNCDLELLVTAVLNF